MLKTSGSKREHLQNGNYSEERHLQKTFDIEDLPSHESIKATQKLYNGKVNLGPLVRFLRGQVGNNWDDIYSEIISRIPTKLLDHRDVVFWFVADKVAFVDGRPWNKKSQQFIWTGEAVSASFHWTEFKSQPQFIEFYVHPGTNKLVQIEQKSFKRRQKKTE